MSKPDKNAIPHHGYLIEPRWITAHAMARELTCLDTWLNVATLGTLGAFLIVIAVVAG